MSIILCLLFGVYFEDVPQRVDGKVTYVTEYVWLENHEEIKIVAGDKGVVVFVGFDLRGKQLADSTTGVIEYTGQGKEWWRIVSSYFPIDGSAKWAPQLLDSQIGRGRPGKRQIYWIDLEPGYHVARFLLHGDEKAEQVVKEIKDGKLTIWVYTYEN